jgi:hypothetical protein
MLQIQDEPARTDRTMAHGKINDHEGSVATIGDDH